MRDRLEPVILQARRDALRPTGLLSADLPRDAVCDPAYSPQQRASIFFPAAAPLLAEQQDRRTPSFACAAA
ncbi:hypothetical protein CWS35_08370 [Bradyrhizobium sp. SK17]|jgi:hypothetical protein|uniref:Uncharacterized protein n=1 Tax=Bradyrhizobium campsiandrae TaxID=1729892 RepID=A0ABR7ULJ0_9BRAD|nr:hypothetical protein [Bradyrhizobium sp. SK17]AUC94293.1 hypothetical protein CWS35_08370 [Bradyrhizobium sp. SK17]MBC9984712.1 hypothetical protein [Bradyrhizobium campsiandrae]